MLRALAWCGIAGILIAAPASAQEGDNERPGFYLGADLSGLFPVSLQENFEFNQSIAAEAEPSLGAGARAGYRIHRNAAVEVQYEWIDEYPVLVESRGNFQISGWAVTANAKGFWPLGQIHPFLLAGVGVLDSTVDGSVAPGQGAVLFRAKRLEGTGVVSRWGAGFEVYLGDHVAATMQISYLLPFGDQDNLDAVSISAGVQYRF